MNYRIMAGGGLALGLLAAGAPLAQSLTIVPASEMTMDTMVVTPARTEQRLADTVASIDVITAEDIKRKQLTTVADALREVPGVTVVESGSRGSNVHILVRGAASDQTLVLIDGVEVNSTTLGSFDFAGLTPDDVERIEVLRGWGGTLYGSEAVGGVVQIFTRRGEGPPRGSVSVAGGNGETDRETADISASSGIFSYSAGVSHLHTDGFKPENDDYENTVVTARVDATPIDRGTARMIFRLGDSEFGNFFSNNFLVAPDPNARQEDDFASVRGDWTHTPWTPLRYRLGVSFAREDQAFDDPPDAAETSTTVSDIVSRVLTLDGQSDLTWWENQAQTILGMEYDRRSADVDSLFSDPAFGDSPARFDETIETIAGYGLQQLFLAERRLVVTGGVRVDDNERFGTAVSPSGGVGYTIAATGTRLRATYAEGFKAPTFNQLFFPNFGNPDLDAETSWEVDGGFDQPLVEGRAFLAATYFHRKVDQLIEAVPNPATGFFFAENVGEATFEGAEVSLHAEVIEGVRLGGQYTYLDADANLNGRVRRPRHNGSVDVALERSGLGKKGDRLSLDLRLLLVGARPDFDPAAFFAPSRNPGYQRADLAASYAWPIGFRWLPELVLFARAENLFDRDYEEILGFGARPFNFLAGMRGEF